MILSENSQALKRNLHFLKISSPQNENLLKIYSPFRPSKKSVFVSSSDQIWRNLELH